MAVDKCIRCPSGCEPDRWCAAGHCLEERNPKTLPRRWHDEEISSSVEVHQLFGPESPQEHDPFLHAGVARKLLKPRTIIAFSSDQVNYIPTTAQQSRK